MLVKNVLGKMGEETGRTRTADERKETGYLTFCKYKQTHAKSTCTVSSLLAQHIAVI